MNRDFIEAVVPWVIFAIAGGSFLAIILVFWLLWMRRGQAVEHCLDPFSCIGRSAVVALPIGQTQLGKVWIELHGQRLELLAMTKSDRTFEIGEIVYGHHWENNQLWVLSFEELWK
jgi:hypothetical protein